MTEIEDWMWDVVAKRVEAMPAHMKLAIGGSGSLSKGEMLEHIQSRDRIGARIVEMQVNYLAFLKSEALKA